MRKMTIAGLGCFAVAALGVAVSAAGAQAQQDRDWSHAFGVRADAAGVGTLSCGPVDDTGTGAGKVDANRVALAPWPACEVRTLLAGPLADSDAPLAVVDPATPKVGDSMQFDLQSPGFASYVYAAYFGADGTVLNLTQPTSRELKPKPPHTPLKFGDAQPDSPGYIVQAPVGDELLLVIASEWPLFDQAMPQVETSRAFLGELRQALLSGAAGRVTATVLPVTTTE